MLYGFSELSASPLYPKYLQFRHRVFNVRLGYHQPGGPVSTFDAFPELKNVETPWASGIEFDSCDTPKTIHFAHLSAVPDDAKNAVAYLPEFQAKITGCVRMLPTNGRYMIRDAIEFDLWKNVQLLKPLPDSADVYEASRIAICPDLAANDPLRIQIVDRLVYGHVELAVRLGVKRIIGLMHRGIWRKVYEKRGIPVDYLSQPFVAGAGHPVLIGAIDINETVLANLETKFAADIKCGEMTQTIIDQQIFLAHQASVRAAAN